jgi:uncharacterized protein
MSSTLDVVRGFYEALGKGDVPAVVELLSPDIEWTEAERFPYYGGTWRAPEEIVKGLFEPLARDWSRFVVQPVSFLSDGHQAVSFGVYLGTHSRSGRSLTAPFAHHWTVQNGKIVRFVQYTDTAKVLEATR